MAAQGPPLQEGCGGQREVCWSPECSNARLLLAHHCFQMPGLVHFSFPEGESLGLVCTGLSSAHTPPAPHHFSVTVPVMSGQLGLTRGSEVPWGPVGGAPQQRPQGRWPTGTLRSLSDKTEEPPASSWGQPLGRLSSPFTEGPGQDGLPQELLISLPSSSAPPRPPAPARPPEALT